jgi:hypothetical protein
MAIDTWYRNRYNKINLARCKGTSLISLLCRGTGSSTGLIHPWVKQFEYNFLDNIDFTSICLERE